MKILDQSSGPGKIVVLMTMKIMIQYVFSTPLEKIATMDLMSNEDFILSDNPKEKSSTYFKYLKTQSTNPERREQMEKPMNITPQRSGNQKKL